MKTIMLADDNALSLEGIEKNIDWEALDCRVVHIKYDGTSAIEAFRQEPVDIIISDIEMPDMDGISMSRLAVSCNPLVKVILISAYDRFDYAKRAIRIGVYDYIEKPIDYPYLAEKIKSACALIDQEQKNLKLLEASRPAMIEQFFHNLLHYSGKEAAYHLTSHMEYLHLTLDYRFYDVLVFHAENAAELKKELGVAQYEMLLYQVQDSIRSYCRVFDHFYLLKDFEGMKVILFQNSSDPSHFLQSIQ